MTLFIISIPLMLVAVAIAVVPLIAMSWSEMRDIAVEVERNFEQERLAHQVHQERRHHIDDEHCVGTPVQAPVTGTESQPPRVPVMAEDG